MSNKRLKDTSWAKKDGVRIYILDAASGKKGYTCLADDCSREMQAVRSKKGRKSYFRHDAKDVQRQGSCSFSNVDERIKIAKQVLQLAKSIKVPPVYKYPPIGSDGPHNKIQGAKTIEAFKVGVNLFFYEDNTGNILWGGKVGAPGFIHLITGDVVFFDQRDFPILIITFADKEKVKDKAKVNLKRLGIDTVQVKIPTGPEQAIRDVFNTSENTKWIYNGTQEKTQYVRVSGTDSEGVSNVDEVQRELFEESFRCRSSQIRNLIRAIGKVLASKPYADAEERLRIEISKLEHTTLRVQEDTTNDLRAEFGIEEETVDRRREELSKRKKLLNKLYQDLQTRYQRQKDEVAAEERFFESRVDQECRVKGNRGHTIGARKREIEESIRKVERDIDFRTKNIQELHRKREALPNGFDGEETKLRKEFERLEADERQYGLEAPARIKRKDIGGSSELSQRIKEILDIRGVIDDITDKELTRRRYIAAKQRLISGDQKTQA